MKRLLTTIAKPWGIQYASGLRADLGWRNARASLTPAAAPALALLGNCGSVSSAVAAANTRDFLVWCLEHWDPIFWVPGPLELSGPAAYTEQLDRIQEVAADTAVAVGRSEESILVMNQTRWSSPELGVTVLGCSGWTECAGFEEGPVPNEFFEGVRVHFQDAAGLRTLAVEDIRDWHRDDIRWLKREVGLAARRPSAMRSILLTHHLCSGHLLNRELPRETYRRMALDVMSVEDIADIVEAQPYAWLCGAAGSCTSGFLGHGRNTFMSVNSARQGLAEMAPAHPAYMPDRRLEVGGAKPKPALSLFRSSDAPFPQLT